MWLGDRITFTCSQQVADWIGHLHRASSLEALPNLSVIIGEPLPQFPHVTNSPEIADIIATQIYQVSNAEEAEAVILEMYAEEMELDELAQAVHEVTQAEEPGKLPRQEVAGQMGSAELPAGEEQGMMTREAAATFMRKWGIQEHGEIDDNLVDRITRVQYALDSNPHLICPERSPKQKKDLVAMLVRQGMVLATRVEHLN